VLRADGTVIAGLYAAGATSGGLEGGPAAGYAGGLMKALTFGLLAAEHAAGR
jgi:fumarate reductase flavoprotein subunit